MIPVLKEHLVLNKTFLLLQCRGKKKRKKGKAFQARFVDLSFIT